MPLDPSQIMLMASTLFKGAKGVQQSFLSKELQSSYDRPVYEIPQAIVESTERARYDASLTRLAEADAIRARFDQNTADQLYEMKKAAQNPSQIVQNIGRIGAAKTRLNQELDIAGVRQQQMNKQRLASTLKDLAGYQAAKFQYDKAQPYQQAQQSAAQLQNASNQNIANSLNAFGQMNYLFNNQNQFGGPQTPIPGTTINPIPPTTLQLGGTAPTIDELMTPISQTKGL